MNDSSVWRSLYTRREKLAAYLAYPFELVPDEEGLYVLHWGISRSRVTVHLSFLYCLLQMKRAFSHPKVSPPAPWQPSHCQCIRLSNLCRLGTIVAHFMRTGCFLWQVFWMSGEDVSQHHFAACDWQQAGCQGNRPSFVLHCFLIWLGLILMVGWLVWEQVPDLPTTVLDGKVKGNRTRIQASNSSK